MDVRDTRNLRERRDTFAEQMARNPESFGRNLKLFRENNLRITQESAADRLKVSLRALQRWEAGEAFPRGSSMDKILTEYDVDLADLMRDEEDAGVPTQTIGERLDTILTNQASIEMKLDVALELFTDAEQLAAAIERRRTQGEPPAPGRRLSRVSPPPTQATRRKSA